MKRILILIAITTCFNATKAQDENPGSYMSRIGKISEEVSQKYINYISAVSHGKSARKQEKRRNELINSISDAKIKIADVGPYKGDKTLKDGSIEYMRLLYNIFNDDYSKIVNMEEIAEQSIDNMELYLNTQEKIDEKLRESGDKRKTEEKTFALKYNVNLIESESERGNKLKTIGEVNEYYHKVYLCLFKSSFQESALIEAIDQKKISSVEQYKSALIKYASEGLAILDTMSGFKGDKTLVNSCKRLLQFHKEEAEKKVPDMVDYILKVENFEEIKKNFNAKSEKSKDDVAAYNKAVDEMNKAVNTYNSSNNYCNNKRKEVLNDWNNTTKTFMDEYMP